MNPAAHTVIESTVFHSCVHHLSIPFLEAHMASPGKSPEKQQGTSQRQETGQGSASRSPSPAAESNVPPPQPQEVQVEGGPDTVTVAVTGTQTRPEEGGVSAPPPAVVASTGTITTIVPGEGTSSSRKRDRGEAGGSSSEAAAAAAGERRQKRRAELVEVPRGPPVCYVCNRAFQSWKAVFGHMRAHKVGEERARSGAFPPPVFTPPGSPEREQQALQEELAPTLLNIAQEVLSRSTTGQDTAAASSSVPRPRPHIDLNEPQLPISPSPSPSAEPDQPAAQPSSPSSGSDRLDLNKPPKNGGDQGDKN